MYPTQLRSDVVVADVQFLYVAAMKDIAWLKILPLNL